MSVWDDLKTGFMTVADPGSVTGWRERDQAERQYEQSLSDWDALMQQIPTQLPTGGYDVSTIPTVPYNAHIAETGEFIDPGEAALQGPSAFEGLTADQDAIAAQKDVLGELGDIHAQGGLTAIDRARIAEAQREQEQFLRSQREADMASLESRGMAGSGAELAMGMSAAQEAAQRRSMADMQTEALAQERAMDALTQQGALAGDIRGQSWGEGAQAASAMDVVEQFNAGQRQNMAQFASQQEQQASQFGAQQQNVDRQQWQDRTSKERQFNAEQKNQAAKDLWGREYDAIWDVHGARERATAGKSGQYAGAAQNQMAQAQDKQAQASGILQAWLAG